MKIKKAVIPAAGLGTRFLPATKSMPKEMLPIVDKPAIQYIVEEAINSGIEEILIITGYSKKAIEDHFDKSAQLELFLEKNKKVDMLKEIKNISNLANIYYIRQKEPLGLGHAISLAKGFCNNEPFGVLLGDDIIDNDIPALKQMIDKYEKYNSTILGVKNVGFDSVHKYGIIKGHKIQDNIYSVNNLVEKPSKEEAKTDIAIMGRYVLNPSIFEILENTKAGKGGEIQLTDALKELEKKEKIYGLLFEGKRYDIGDKLGYLQATIDFALKREDLSKDLLSFLKGKINSN